MKVSCKLMDFFCITMKIDVRPCSLFRLASERENAYAEDICWDFGADTLINSLLLLRVVSFSLRNVSISIGHCACYNVLGYNSLDHHQYKKKLGNFFENVDITQIVLMKSVCVLDFLLLHGDFEKLQFYVHVVRSSYLPAGSTNE